MDKSPPMMSSFKSENIKMILTLKILRSQKWKSTIKNLNAGRWCQITENSNKKMKKPNSLVKFLFSILPTFISWY